MRSAESILTSNQPNIVKLAIILKLALKEKERRIRLGVYDAPDDENNNASKLVKKIQKGLRTKFEAVGDDAELSIAIKDYKKEILNNMMEE